MREVWQRIEASWTSASGCVLCTVVETRGSTPQKAGASMAVFPDGGQVGTLGGGCVEAEVRQRALGHAQSAEPILLTFTLDDDYGWDDGLICGGRMTILAQPINPAAPSMYFKSLARLVATGRGGIEAVSIDESKSGAPVGARVLLDHAGEVAATHGIKSPSEPMIANAPELGSRPRPRSESGTAYLPILPRCRLVIIGGGHVGQAVAGYAHEADFDVWVIDDREKYACRERFPHAERIIVEEIGRACKALETDGNTYCIIVTRGHSHDEEALYHLAEKPTRYLGMIGSKRKIRMIFDDLEKEGVSPAAIERVHAPLGLDIGSQTVPEIAISIVAQLIGHRNLGPDAFPPPSQQSIAACR